VSAKQEFSSARLPEHLTPEERFRLWRDIHYAEVATVEVGISELPFEATLQAVVIGQLTYAKMSGTVNRVTRTPDSIRAAPRDDYLLVMNLGSSVIAGTYGSKEIAMTTGDAFLDAIQPQQFTGGDRNVWANLVVPRKLLSDKFASIADKQGLLIASNNEALSLLRNYLTMIDDMNLQPGSALLDHVSNTIVDLVGLATGAKGEQAEIAGARGLRAARLQAVLERIKANYRNPTLSASLVGSQLGLSARYVQDLLTTTGMSFAERVLELRLQDAKTMLTDPRHREMRIGTIAMEVGFSDVSYFNRSFKRRFGCSPSAAR